MSHIDNPSTSGGGGSGTVTSFSFTDGNGFTSTVTNPTTTPDLSLVLQDAKADGTTLGQAAFTASDFNDNGSGLISIDYTNGQAADATHKGFLTSTDWTTFNSKLTTLPVDQNLSLVSSATELNFNEPDDTVVFEFPSTGIASVNMAAYPILTGRTGNMGPALQFILAKAGTPLTWIVGGQDQNQNLFFQPSSNNTCTNLRGIGVDDITGAHVHLNNAIGASFYNLTTYDLQANSGQSIFSAYYIAGVLEVDFNSGGSIGINVFLFTSDIYTTSTPATIDVVWSYLTQPNYETNQGNTLTITSDRALIHQPVLNGEDGTVAIDEFTGVFSHPRFQNQDAHPSTISTRRGVFLQDSMAVDANGLGTVVDFYGIDIEDQTVTNVSVSLRSVGANVEMHHAGVIQVGLTGTRTGEVEFNGTTSGTVSLKAADVAGSATFILPDADGVAGQFIKTDGSGVLSFATPSGSGNVSNAGSSTDNAIARFDGASGTAIQNSGIVIDDGNSIIFPSEGTPVIYLVIPANQTTSNTDGNGVIYGSGSGEGSGKGGAAGIGAGAGGSTGAGGDTYVVGGNAGGGNANGGDIVIRVGEKDGSGVNGKLKFTNPSTSLNAILNYSTITSSDKTFSLLDETGTLLVKTDTKALTGQNTNIGSTPLSGSTPGLYRLSYYLLDTSADLTAGAVTLNLTWTDDAVSNGFSSSGVILTVLGSFTQGTQVIRLASGTINYTVTHTGIFGSATYALYITLERLN